ncbi:uncharacterized protein LOC143244375 [Tachypleus tridentatus]|uniref:uncharacterized protein LOC143244375 n=1 Tax=Tachypleus tridentatus TaxID=6853 RepID=UPI003FCF2B4E
MQQINKDCKIKRVKLNGAQKRKQAKKNQQKALDLVAETGKLIFSLNLLNMIFQIKTHLCHQKSLALYLTLTRLKLNQAPLLQVPLVNSSNISSINVDASCSTRQSEVEIISKNEIFLDFGKMLQSTKDEKTKAKDPGLWLDLSADDVTYWIACGPTDCQHHNEPFGKSCRTFNSGKLTRYCHKNISLG